MRSFRRAVLLGAVLVSVLGPLLAASDAAGETGRVGVAVVHQDQTVRTDCVAIPSGGARALQVLDKTSFDLYTQFFSGLGRAVCFLDGEGYPPTDPRGCFGNSTDPSWGFWVQSPGTSKPHMAQTGVSRELVRPGSVIYFEFATYDPLTFKQPPPPPQKLSGICASASPSPSPTP